MDIFEDDSEEMMLRLVEMVDLEERMDLEKTVDPTEEDQNCTHNSGKADLSDDDLDNFFEKGYGCKKRKDNKLCCTLLKKRITKITEMTAESLHVKNSIWSFLPRLKHT